MKKLCYLACPYYHEDHKVMSKRVNEVTKFCGNLLQQGIYCFSPVTQNSLIRKKCNIEAGWKIWGEYDLTLLGHCDGLIVLKLDGWKKSKGVRAEIKEAKRLGMKIFYVDYEDSLLQKIQKREDKHFLSLVNKVIKP